MRRIIMFNRVSADGCFADTEGGLGWAVPDEELDREATQGMPGIDAMLFGRKTYDAFESFWPHALDQDPHAAGRRNDSLRAMATWINATPKLVFSRSKKQLTWRNSQLLPEFTPALVEELKRGPGLDIIVFGSGSIVSLLSQHRLIDEYQFIVSPLLLGSSKQPVTGLAQSVGLDLVEAKQYTSGNLKLRYALG